MHEPDQLDPRLAARLARAADRDPASAPRLDAAARARVLAAMIEQSAQLRRPRRRLGWTTGALAAVAASVAVAWFLRPVPNAEPAAQPVVAAPDTACGLPTASTGVQIVLEASRQHVALGRFGQLAAERDAALRIVSSTPCELTVELMRGMVAAELHDLRPARLRVRTALGDVEVRGTTFSVRVAASPAHAGARGADEAARALEVVLVHGAVDVVSGPQIARMRPGQTLRREKRGAAPRIEASTRSAALAIETLMAGGGATSAVSEPVRLPVSDAAAAPSPSEAAPADAASRASSMHSATELLTRAERERRAGQLDAARALYREAGTRRGADAEVALLRWTRLELSAHAPLAAREVLARYRLRFASGRLSAEASWLELRAHEELGDVARARASARELVRKYPDSPHAQAAQRLLSAP